MELGFPSQTKLFSFKELVAFTLGPTQLGNISGEVAGRCVHLDLGSLKLQVSNQINYLEVINKGQRELSVGGLFLFVFLFLSFSFTSARLAR